MSTPGPLLVPYPLNSWQELNRRTSGFSADVLARLEALEASTVEEAPIDGQRYVRRNGAWEVLP